MTGFAIDPERLSASGAALQSVASRLSAELAPFRSEPAGFGAPWGSMSPHFTTHTIGGGHVRPGQPKGSGYHYRPGGEDFPDRRLVPGSEVAHPLGVYEAEPEFFDPALNLPAGAWKPRSGNGGVSTFFPDDWTPA